MSKRIKTLKGRETTLNASESESSDSDSGDSFLSEMEMENDDSDGENEMEDDLSKGENETEDKFATSMAKILGSRVKAQDRENPILIRSKKIANEIEESKLDAKARAALRAEKLNSRDKARVKDIVPKDPEEAGDAMSRERMLRRTAQRGVVRLMNAINQAQRVEEDGVDDERQDKVLEMSKDKFLEAIRGG